MMVAEDIPEVGQVPDPEEQKTILQNIRYFNRKELVQYVCHADDESREEERRLLGNVSIFGLAKASSESQGGEEKKTKKNAKLVRFNSRPQIYKEQDDVVDYDAFKHARDRPGTPKPAKKDEGEDSEKDIHFPPLKKHVIEPETTVSSKGMFISSSEPSGSTLEQSATRTVTSKFLANITHPSALGCSPPTTDSMLKRVLNRGRFGGSQNSLISITEAESDAEKARNARPRRAKSLRWLSPKLGEKDSDSSSESGSTRSSSLTRSDTHRSNRELMTSPLTTLQLRESMGSGLSETSSLTSKSSAITDVTANYPIMTPEEHFEFIKYALSPSLSPVDQSAVRSRATTISGGEKPEWLLQRRRKMKGLNKSLQSTGSSSLEKIGTYAERRAEIIKRSSKKHVQPLEKRSVKKN